MAQEQLDIQRIKKYNDEYKAYTEKSANTRAQLELSKSEVNRLCAELTQELGVQVTPDNLESIYTQCVDKIQHTLEAGEEILKRIKEEENKTVQATEQGANVSGIMPGFGELPPMFSSSNGSNIGI